MIPPSISSAGVVIAHIKGVEQTLQPRLPDLNRVQTSTGLGVPAWSAHFAKDPVALRRVLHLLRRNFADFTPGSLEWCKGEKHRFSCAFLPSH